LERYGLNLDHPEILKAILAGILETGHVIGREGGRTVLAVAVDDWLMDELEMVGADDLKEERTA
jgi:hypothetical protein